MDDLQAARVARIQSENKVMRSLLRQWIGIQRGDLWDVDDEEADAVIDDLIDQSEQAIGDSDR